jgi:hypothetical protein
MVNFFMPMCPRDGQLLHADLQRSLARLRQARNDDTLPAEVALILQVEPSEAENLLIQEIDPEEPGEG